MPEASPKLRDTALSLIGLLIQDVHATVGVRTRKSQSMEPDTSAMRGDQELWEEKLEDPNI